MMRVREGGRPRIEPTVADYEDDACDGLGPLVNDEEARLAFNAYRAELDRNHDPFAVNHARAKAAVRSAVEAVLYERLQAAEEAA